jgi:nucleoside 2-deoxyribosyltransferase
MSKVIYLSIPYTFWPQKSFEIANKISAKLMTDEAIVFSPISHSHPIADNMPIVLRTDHEFWMKQDLEMLNRCDELLVVVINTEKQSGKELIKKKPLKLTKIFLETNRYQHGGFKLVL